MAEALDNFNQVITVPSTSISEIVVCALKKARLVSLILTGQVYELPKLTSTIVSKFSKSDVSLYDNIGNLYTNNDMVGLNLLIENSSEALHIDQNYGLAKQVVSSLNRNNVKKLTNTYITMSLNDINNRCVNSDNNSDNINYSKNLLIDMITKNEISANIDEVTGLVKFGINNNNEEDNHKFLALLERNMIETVSLSEKLRSMQKTILVSTQYISKNLPKSSSPMDWEDDMHKGI
jgi:COP9 signalosome complex subunit 3